ncbi:hypothetical protein MKW98_002373 [Papaver atlanticum]|uniref:UBC core domain-containing protein n=1 Tax=Papaver atlanticum TaxID=357466 RepID=A0AAD4SB55_9MAGN|nr:hypothetical protein MKW98_002373 [Papaver atlanticum]
MDQELEEIRVVGEIEEEEEQQQSNERREFRIFDIIETGNEIKGHRYFSSPSSLSPTSNKKIMQEWKILERNLPADSIYVRVYEERIDLLRAHEGLFFFDIQFPPDYPNVPPSVSYHSFGHRLNPNLYANGAVCPSLINTWAGLRKNEKWIPSQSTIFQVLLSIQGVVLNAKPYFNEPLYLLENLNPWKKKLTLDYNEKVFIKSCKAMVCVLNKPPNHFQEFVVDHFRNRAETILNACKAYISGHIQIGDHLVDATSTTAATRKKGSKTTKIFQSLMGEFYPTLVKAFIKNGSPLESYQELDKVDGISYTCLEELRWNNNGYCCYFILLFIILCLVLKFVSDK